MAETSPFIPLITLLLDHERGGDPMSRMQRREGQAGEREAAALIHDHTGWPAQQRLRTSAD